MTNTNNQVTIEEILTHCDISKKAIEVINCFKFFLRTNEDKATFINEFEGRLVWKQRNPVFEAERLAKEIGSYHYTYDSYTTLEQMDMNTALETLFLEPLNICEILQFEYCLYKQMETVINCLV
ncbi:hypothetical protein [Paenibacillus pseudetheri]|uniref:Uncharacterized protein n=1 Tax=Paenibacillus pseudetheri TaxID=2897682 RepID=A0ABN8FFF0_9BACL|nr:hypothetical protein [Paenibacillus pseudetheri]CAH1055087.1 hypothetical protein PAECIP111894_01237 [Paenibacillus pseudetheri]